MTRPALWSYADPIEPHVELETGDARDQDELDDAECLAAGRASDADRYVVVDPGRCSCGATYGAHTAEGWAACVRSGAMYATEPRAAAVGGRR